MKFFFLEKKIILIVFSGVKAEFLIDACIKRPDLLTALSLNASASWNVLELLVERCGMTFEDAMRFFVG